MIKHFAFNIEHGAVSRCDTKVQCELDLWKKRHVQTVTNEQNFSKTPPLETLSTFGGLLNDVDEQ